MEEAAREEQKEKGMAGRKAGAGNRGVGNDRQTVEAELQIVCVTRTRSPEKKQTGEAETWKNATSAAIKDNSRET